MDRFHKQPALMRVLLKMARNALLGMGSSVTLPALMHSQRMGRSNTAPFNLRITSSLPVVFTCWCTSLSVVAKQGAISNSHRKEESGIVVEQPLMLLYKEYIFRFLRKAV